jgi:hypothetical protein
VNALRLLNAHASRAIQRAGIRALRQETWFLGKVFAAAAREGLRGVVSFANSVVRRAADGRLVVPGHAGLIYQAKGAEALGRSDAATMLMLPNGTTLDRRALSKVRRGECGHEYVERRLAAFGVAARRPGESGGAFLAMPEICQKLRYIQPHAAPRPNPRQHLPPARSCGNGRLCTAS